MGSQRYGYSSFEFGCNQHPGGFYSPQQPRVCQVVSQLRSAKEDHNGFTVGDTELNMVSLVGIVRRVSSSMSCMLYLLDDMTGSPIDAQLWQENSTILPGTYVKVTGRVRSFENHRSVIALNIHRLHDLNEITSHILEVIQAHMFNRHALPNKINEMPVTSTRTGLQPGVKRVEGDSSASACGLRPFQNEVLNLIKSCSDRQGMSFWTLRCSVSPENAVYARECVQFLINEGHIYTTVDENHFKATYD